MWGYPSPKKTQADSPGSVIPSQTDVYIQHNPPGVTGDFSMKIDKILLKGMWKYKRPKIAEEISKRMNKTENLAPADVKTRYVTTAGGLTEVQIRAQEQE